MKEFLMSHKAETANTPISYWAYPGIAETEVLIQTSRCPHIPTANRVIEVCCEHFDITLEEFWSQSRTKRIVVPRRFAGFLLFHFCGWSFVKLAKFVKKDRTNMMHHVRQLEDQMSVYKEERDHMYQLLTKLEIINTSSSGSDWYYSWAHEQLKQPQTYLEIAKKDAADALKEIIAVMHADGRGVKDKKRKMMRNKFILEQKSKMTTIGDYKKLLISSEILDEKKKKERLEAFAKSMKETMGRKEKFDPKVINKYDKY